MNKRQQVLNHDRLNQQKPKFSLTEIIAKAHVDTKAIIIEAPRNCGKTYAGQQLVKDYILDRKKNKFVWVREQQNEADESLDAFVTRYADLGYRSDMKRGRLLDYDGSYVGLYVGLKADGRTRSGTTFYDELQEIRTDWLIFDEYNTMNGGIKNSYMKFTQLLASVERANPNFKVILIGNRDKATNPFLHRIGLKPSTDFKKTMIETDISEYGRCEVHRIGIDDVYIYFNKNSVARYFASKDPDLDRYLNQGGFLIEGIENVLNFEKWIAPTFKPLTGIVIQGVSYVLGEFEHYDKGYQYVLSKDAVFSYKGDYIAVDIFSRLTNARSQMININASDTFGRLIFDEYANRNLFFDDFDTLEQIKLFVVSSQKNPHQITKF